MRNLTLWAPIEINVVNSVGLFVVLGHDHGAEQGLLDVPDIHVAEPRLSATSSAAATASTSTTAAVTAAGVTRYNVRELIVHCVGSERKMLISQD